MLRHCLPNNGNWESPNHSQNRFCVCARSIASAYCATSEETHQIKHHAIVVEEFMA